MMTRNPLSLIYHLTLLTYYLYHLVYSENFGRQPKKESHS